MRITQPREIVPRQRGCDLPFNYAEIAENIDVSSGQFTPWRTPVEILTFDEPILVAHVRDCCWTGSSCQTSRYVDAGLDRKTYLSRAHERPLVTHDVCEPDWCYLGYPVPVQPVVYSDLGEPFQLGPEVERRTYVITYGSDCEEGPASCPSDPVKVTKDSRVGIQLPPPPDPMWKAEVVRIYQSVLPLEVSEGVLDLQGGPVQSGLLDPADQQEYYLVAEMPVTQTSLVLEGSPELGLQLVSEQSLPPQEGALICGESSRGSLVAYWDSTVAFSERNCHWAFPLRTWHDFPYEIKDVKVCQDTIFVLTCGGIYVIQDTVDGSGVSQRPVQEIKGEDLIPSHCLSCVVSQNGVWYTSSEGLVYVDVTGSARLVSRQAFGRDDWKTLGPIRSVTIAQGMVILSTDRGEYLWDLSLDENGNLPADLTTLSFPVDQWIEDDQENLYYLYNGTIYQFNAGDDYLSMTWRQAEQRIGDRQRTSAISAEYVKKDTPDHNVISVYRGGKLSVQKKLGNRPRRIRNTVTDCFQIEVKGTEPMCTLSYGQGLNSLSR